MEVKILNWKGKYLISGKQEQTVHKQRRVMKDVNAAVQLWSKHYNFHKNICTVLYFWVRSCNVKLRGQKAHSIQDFLYRLLPPSQELECQLITDVGVLRNSSAVKKKCLLMLPFRYLRLIFVVFAISSIW